MTDSRNSMLEALAQAVVKMDEIATQKLASEALATRLDAWDILSEGMIKGMKIVSDKYETGEYFVPELLLCSDALYAGLDVIRPHLGYGDNRQPVRIVLGVVEGDTHDIGKNIVKIMLEGSGFEVIDLGKNVPLERFIEIAIEHQVQVIGLSTLMTTGMDAMEDMMRLVDQKGLKGKFKVIIGGAPTSSAFARQIGADGYAPNAPGAVRLVQSLISG